MSSFQRILFPFDYSPACEAIVPFVREMVSRFSAELTVLHVLPLYADPSEVGTFLGAVPLFPLSPDHRKPEEEKLQDFCSEHFADLKVEAVLEDGDVARAIERIAADRPIDLVMMPTSGAGPIRRLLLGSVTSKILHDLHCAVWTGVHGHLPSHGLDVSCRKILCAIGSDEKKSKELTVCAADLAKSLSSSLALIHVVETPPITWDLDLAPYRDQLMGDAEKRLLGLAAELGGDATVRVFADTIPVGIREAAVQEDADLIVLGRGHSQEGLGSVWSDLYATVRIAPCPVLSYS